MVDEDIGCCATFQKWMIFIVNILLFFFGVLQIGVACYVLVAGSDSLGFAAEVLDGNDSAVQAMLAFGILIVIISFVACIGAKMESICMLWLYAVILFCMIMGQAMTVAVTGVSVEYGDSIFESLWKKLDATVIDDIETTYECCSFNGKDAANTWPADTVQYADCSTKNDWVPMETCWEKFEKTINDNYDMVRTITIVVLAVQIVIYFSTHYVIQSIAEAEGVESQHDIEISGGIPKV